MPEISLIIPVSENSNTRDLEVLLRSISKQTLKDIEVLVVTSRALTVQTDWPRVSVVSCPRDCGASASRNQAAQVSKGEILGFLDDDVVLDPKWCEAAANSLEDVSVGLVSGAAWVDLNGVGLDYIPKELLWVVGGSYLDESQTSLISGAMGMNLCVRKESFQRVGGYNVLMGPCGDRPESKRWMRLGAEEDDLALRISGLCGERVLFNPRMVARHKLRRNSATPKSILKRSLHVGHNRAYIHLTFPREGSETDQVVLRKLVVSTLSAVLVIPRNPLGVWKRLSLISIVSVGFALGYLVGSFRFRVLRRSQS